MYLYMRYEITRDVREIKTERERDSVRETPTPGGAFVRTGRLCAVCRSLADKRARARADRHDRRVTDTSRPLDRDVEPNVQSFASEEPRESLGHSTTTSEADLFIFFITNTLFSLSPSPIIRYLRCTAFIETRRVLQNEFPDTSMGRLSLYNLR